jgi:hypothetical protein
MVNETGVLTRAVARQGLAGGNGEYRHCAIIALLR